MLFCSYNPRVIRTQHSGVGEVRRWSNGFFLLALVGALLGIGHPHRTMRVADPQLPPSASSCSLDNLASPDPWSTGAHPDYDAILRARIAACVRKAPFQRHVCTGAGAGDVRLYETLVQCVSYQPKAKPTPAPTPTVAFKAGAQALYVYMDGGTGSAASLASGGIDNPGTLLLWVVAMQLQNDFFDNPGSNVDVIPESQWKSTDFRDQCSGDPYDKTRSRGTLGAIALSGATIASAGDSWLLVTQGWTHTAYSATLFSCVDSTDGVPIIQGTAMARGQSYRVAVPLVPAALIGTWITERHKNQNASPTPASTPNLLDTAEVLALAQVATSLSTYTLGNASPVMTVPRAFVDSARDLSEQLITFCHERGIVPDTTGLHYTSAFAQSMCKNDLLSVRPWSGGWPPPPCVAKNEASTAVLTRATCTQPERPLYNKRKFEPKPAFARPTATPVSSPSPG